MDADQKRAMIDSRRSSLEMELYAAELDLKVAKKGNSDELIAGPQARVAELKDKLAVLDDEEGKIKG